MKNISDVEPEKHCQPLHQGKRSKWSSVFSAQLSSWPGTVDSRSQPCTSKTRGTVAQGQVDLTSFQLGFPIWKYGASLRDTEADPRALLCPWPPDIFQPPVSASGCRGLYLAVWKISRPKIHGNSEVLEN